MTFINLTPHTINIVGCSSIPPSGSVARCSMVTMAEGMVEGVPVVARQIGPLEGLPAPSDGTIFIVSAMVRDAAELAGRTDCLSPGDLVRNEEGQVIGCQSLMSGLDSIMN